VLEVAFWATEIRRPDSLLGRMEKRTRQISGVVSNFVRAILCGILIELFTAFLTPERAYMQKSGTQPVNEAAAFYSVRLSAAAPWTVMPGRFLGCRHFMLRTGPLISSRKQRGRIAIEPCQQLYDSVRSPALFCSSRRLVLIATLIRET
jgi:hypothetical protein